MLLLYGQTSWCSITEAVPCPLMSNERLQLRWACYVAIVLASHSSSALPLISNKTLQLLVALTWLP